MPKYSQTLPKLTYNGVTISDITHRIDMLKSVRKYEALYYTVRISEDMTPELLAEQTYRQQFLRHGKLKNQIFDLIYTQKYQVT